MSLDNNRTVLSDGISGLTTRGGKANAVPVDINSNYYIQVSAGGWSWAIPGYPSESALASNGWSYDIDPNDGMFEGSTLPNCVGFAYGRFNEMVKRGSCNLLPSAPNPVKMWDLYIQYLFDGEHYLQRGKVPRIGALVIWDKVLSQNNKTGHVAVVEEVIDDHTIKISESAWHSSYLSTGWTYKTIDLNNGVNEYSKLLGFIYNPYVDKQGYYLTKGYCSHYDVSDRNPSNQTGSTNEGGAVSEEEAETVSEDIFTVQYHQKKLETVKDYEELQDTKKTFLLTYPSLVESPFVMMTCGDYTFGSYMKVADSNKIHVQFPNYINSLSVVKTNGSVNQYTIKLIYQIQAGEDPNFIDKILSKVGVGGKISIKYGDWMCPDFIYLDENAILLKVTSKVNFLSSKIEYTVTAMSSVASTLANKFAFPSLTTKPSTAILTVLKNPNYGLSSIFTGMNESNYGQLIPTDDKSVEIPSKSDLDPLSYINFLVTYMSSETNSDDAILKDSSYYLTINDDSSNNYGGPYFKITKVNCDQNAKTLVNENVYEVDIGFPSDTLVTGFDISDDNSWALLYKYSESVSPSSYTYNIDDSGNIVADYTPSAAKSQLTGTATEAQKTWWTNMTKFPVKATLTIKGLLRPILLMSKVKINAYFYGQKHTASGIYYVTKQTDIVSGTGYRTVLELQKYASDLDYEVDTVVEETRRVVHYKSNSSSSTDGSSSSSTSSSKYDVKDSTLIAGTYDAQVGNNAYKYYLKKNTRIYAEGEMQLLYQATDYGASATGSAAFLGTKIKSLLWFNNYNESLVSQYSGYYYIYLNNQRMYFYKSDLHINESYSSGSTTTTSTHITSS